MGKETLLQIVLSSTLIIISIIAYFIFNEESEFFELAESFGEFVLFIIVISTFLGLIISQLAVNLWFITRGFTSIGYTKNFSLYGNKNIIQIVFDRYKYGRNNEKKEYICESIKEYINKKITFYIFNLVVIFTSILIIFTEAYLFIIIDTLEYPWYISSTIFHSIIIWFALIYKEKVADDLYNFEEFYLKEYKVDIIRQIENFK